MSSIVLLGTGCPSPSDLRFGPSSLFTHNNRKYLFDCGSGVTQRLSAMGVKSSEIDIVFITHMHSDHIIDLYQLFISGWHQGRDSKFQIVGPRGIKAFFNNLLTAFQSELEARVQWEKRPNMKGLEYEITEIDDSYSFASDDISIQPFEVDHFPVEPAYGYQIKYFQNNIEKVIVISGDTRKSENLIQHATGADALVHEVFVDLEFDEKRMSKETLLNVCDYHTTPKELGEIANIARVKKLILTHFVPTIFDEKKVISDISQTYNGQIIIGEDLMSVDI